MIVNNVLCETLNPESVIAKLYTRASRYTREEVRKIERILKTCQIKNDMKSYYSIVSGL